MSYDSPAVILYDANGNPVTIDGYGDGYFIGVLPRALSSGGYIPSPESTYPELATGDVYNLTVDAGGLLGTRGPVLTDEDSFFDDFIHPTLDENNWTVDMNDGYYVIENSILIMSSGINAGDYSHVLYEGDYLPIAISFYMKIYNRDANFVSKLGLSNNSVEALKEVVIRFRNANPFIFEFESTASATQVQSSVITFPNNRQTSDWHLYTIEIGAGYASLYVDDDLVARHKRHLPGPYDVMNMVIEVDTLTNNNGSNKMALYIDSVMFRNHNVVEIAGHFTGDPINVKLQKDSNVIIKGPGVSNHLVSVEQEGSYSRLFSADAEVLGTLNQILTSLQKIEKHLCLMNDTEIEDGDLDNE